MADAASRHAVDTLAAQAADWIVRLSADDAAERTHARRGFDAWKQADPRHAAAAAELEQFVDRLQQVRDSGARPARAALKATLGKRRNQRARRAGATLALVAALLLPAWLLVHTYALDALHVLAADRRTAIGEWQTHTLADGSQITLSGDSAINVRFTRERRVVELLRGEILVDVARDSARPFDVETVHGRIRALGTRFGVEREAGFTELAMFESKVAVRSVASSAQSVVAAGWRLRFDDDGIDAATAFDAPRVESAWRQHQLVVSDQPLPEVLDALAAQRHGLLHFDREQLASIRVSAVLPLDDSDAALRLLAKGFPQLRLRTLTPFFVAIDAAAETPVDTQ